MGDSGETQHVTVVATIRAKPGKSEELGERLKQIVAPSRAEAGCINYDLHRCVDDPDVWLFYENWRSAEALDAHARTDHFQALMRDTAPLADSEVRKFTMISTPA